VTARLDALLLAINAPDLASAACRGRHELFDLRPVSDPGREDIEHAALEICRSCPMQRDCRAWWLSLDLRDRPLGVVAGEIHRTRPREHKPSPPPPMSMRERALAAIEQHQQRTQQRQGSRDLSQR
jgi:hypothetical protein